MSKATYVVAGLNGFFATSKDGKRWKETEGREGNTYSLITFGEEECLITGTRGGESIFTYSKNGIKWDTSYKDTGWGQSPKMAFKYKGKLYGMLGDVTNVGNTHPKVTESSDGQKWSNPKFISKEKSKMLKKCCVVDDKIIAVGDYGRKSVGSDPYSWEDAKDTKPTETLIDIAYGNGVFVGSGLHGMRMTSKDGIKWSKPEMGEEGEHINSIFFDGKQFVGVGLGATYFSPNGRSWKRVVNDDAPYLVTYQNGLYVGAKWKGKIYTSRDGIKWQQSANLKGAVTSIGSGLL